MDSILTGYQVSQPAWLYLSSLLIIAIFFRFRRLWSLRNFDLYLLLSLSPGVLLVRSQSGYAIGYAWLFVVTGLVVIRMLFDPLFTQRSRIDPNLTAPAITFLGICAFAFLMTEAVTRTASPSSVKSVIEGQRLLDAATGPEGTTLAERLAQPVDPTGLNTAGPTASLLALPVMSTSRQLLPDHLTEAETDRPFGIVEETAARILAVLAHMAILAGLYWIGRQQFGDRTQGLAMALLYLLMPCTSYVVNELNQVLPCACLLWALVFHSRPLWAGIFMGGACGAMFFPVFLLPVWASYYGWKKSWRFFAGVGLVAVVLLGAVALISADTYAFTQQTINRIDFQVLSFDGGPHETGFWTAIHPAYRIPVMIAFLLLLMSLTIWPRKKNLETLLAYSTAIIASTQFWYPQLGGVYVLWYLPLLILVIFRPRLQVPRDTMAPGTGTSIREGQRSPGSLRSSGINSLSQPLYR